MVANHVYLLKLLTQVASCLSFFSFFLIKKKQKIKGNDAAPLPGPSDS
jgi:hypothetical protein